MSRIPLIDLFAGIGGLSIGFEMAGFACVAGVEREERQRCDFKRAHPNADIEFADVIGLSGKSLLKRAGLVRGELGVLVGGPPCQPFSMAGKRLGTEDSRGRLISEYVRLVDELRPKAFVMENVVGLLSIHNGALIRQILQRMRRLGYAVSEPTILNAANYGVPQMRKRMFIVGLRGTKTFEFPKATHGPLSPLLPTNSRNLRPYVTVEDAIGDLPSNGSLNDDSGISDTDEINYSSDPFNYYQIKMRSRRKAVSGNKITIHQPHILEAISLAALPFGAEDPSTRYRRLWPDQPSFTLRAGSGSFTALRPIHPYRPRVITIREAARLQSFPDRIKFSAIKRSAYQEIGNSVPPLLGLAIAQRVHDFL
jgi:DNA (cytosine-5)-methyltransferase 1